VLPFDHSPVEGAVAYYAVTIDSVAAQTFTLKAAAQGAQVSDVCGDLTLDNAGTKTASGTGVNCW